MGRPLDTSAAARERQLDLYRAMTPEDRLRLADDMSTEVRELARAGIRARVREAATAAEVEAELVRMLGDVRCDAAGRVRRAATTR
jgi:hypothetical protein